MLTLHSDSYLELVIDWAAGEPSDLQEVEASVGRIHACRKGIGGFCGDVVDGATRSVLSKACALRTLQHLDARQVQGGQLGPGGVGERGLVDIDGDRRRRGEVAVEK